MDRAKEWGGGQKVGRVRTTGRRGGHAPLAELHEIARSYVNYLQPAFKLKSKTREGAKVVKKYHVSATPYERLLSDDRLTDKCKKSCGKRSLRLTQCSC